MSRGEMNKCQLENSIIHIVFWCVLPIANPSVQSKVSDKKCSPPLGNEIFRTCHSGLKTY